MAKLEITLHTKDGDVTYKQEHISGQKLIDYLKMESDIESAKGLSLADNIEKRVTFIAGLFPDSAGVTPETVINGLDAWEIYGTINKLFRVINGEEDDNSKKE